MILIKKQTDVNAGLLVIEPNNKEYQAMIDELQGPTNGWVLIKSIKVGVLILINLMALYLLKILLLSGQNYLTKR